MCHRIHVPRNTTRSISFCSHVSCAFAFDNVDCMVLNPLPDDKFYTLPNWKRLQTTLSNLTKSENQKTVPHLFIFLISYFHLLLNWTSLQLAYEVIG